MTALPRAHMTSHTTSLSALAPLEAQVVRYLRLWAEGTDGLGRITADLCDNLGPVRGLRVQQLWQELCNIFSRFGLRPLEIHATGSDCVSADEAGFAHLIAIAAEARREDAMFAALMMVRADVTPIVVSLATQVGLSLRQYLFTVTHTPDAATHHGVARLH